MNPPEIFAYDNPRIAALIDACKPISDYLSKQTDLPVDVWDAFDSALHHIERDGATARLSNAAEDLLSACEAARKKLSRYMEPLGVKVADREPLTQIEAAITKARS